MSEGTAIVSKETVEGLIDSLMDRQSQLDIQLKGVTLSWPGTPMALQLSGTLTVSLHFRELSDDEKAAHSAATVSHLRA
jgi:hypothetical protein